MRSAATRRPRLGGAVEVDTRFAGSPERAILRELDEASLGANNERVPEQRRDLATQPSWRVRVLFVAVYACMLGLVAEGGARLWYAVRGSLAARATEPAESPQRVVPTQETLDAAGRALGLDAYELPDARHAGRWRLRAGYTATVREILEAKRRDGRLLAVRYIERRAPELGVGLDDIAVRINSDGFRGPELDPERRRYRILTLGDSCTFGSPLSQWHSYPRALERELQRLGFDVEVVNGGVEGYGPADVLARRGDFVALRPQLTTVYLGWNPLYMEPFLDDRRGLKGFLASARLAARAFELARERIIGAREAASVAYERPKRPDPHASDLRLLQAYTPSFLPELVRVVDEMEAAGSHVVLLTLPGLFTTARAPSTRALEIGHLPGYTDNPYVLARMTERYNDALRGLARERGLALVDLDRWARAELQPPEDHFIDSVHLDDLAQERAGAYLAGVLAPLLSEAARVDR
jgi:lysophospholipase L1-like esterase